MNSLRKPLAAVLVALPLVLTGCSGQEGDVDVETPNVEVTPGDLDVDAPEVDAPDVDAPDVDAPEVDAPDVDAPDVDAPDVDAPDVDADVDVEQGGDADAEAGEEEPTS